MTHPANTRHRMLNTGWIGPRCIGDTKADLVFVVEDLHKVRTLTVHAQRLLSYPTQPLRMKVRRRLLEHAEYLHSSVQPVSAFNDARVSDENYKMLVLAKLDRPQRFSVIANENLLREFAGAGYQLPTHIRKRSMKKNILDFYFKWNKTLVGAETQNSIFKLFCILCYYTRRAALQASWSMDDFMCLCAVLGVSNHVSAYERSD